LADILVWDYFKVRGGGKLFVDTLESKHPELGQAIEQIKEAISLIPTNLMYQGKILDILEKGLPGVDMAVVTQLLMPGRHKGAAVDYTLAIPKLNLASKQVAQDLADKVCSTFWKSHLNSPSSRSASTEIFFVIP
jgi:hypothetical protein